MGALTRGAAALAAVGACCVAYGTFIERRWYRLRRESLPVLRSDGQLRVLLLADTHLSPPDRPLERFVSHLAELEFDLVVAAGDLIGAEGAEDATIRLLEPLVADGTPGIAVLGSNDQYAPRAKNPFVYFLDPDRRIHGPPLDTAAFRRGLKGTGWLLLEGERATLDTPAGRVHIAGLPDPHLRTAPMPPPDAIRTPDDGVLHLGIVHAPYRRALDLLEDAGYDLLLSGHTHGGQVRFPPIGAVTTNSDLPTDRARGTSRHGDAWLHVTAGLGQSQYAPFRFACRPEASLLTLTPARDR